MSYRTTGLQRALVAPLFAMHDAILDERGAQQRVTSADKGWPCRISLEATEARESLVLPNHLSHGAASPYKSSYAIYVREKAREPAEYFGFIPPVFERWEIALRAFDIAGMWRHAARALHGRVDDIIRALFAAGEIAYIHAHNAAHGCFAVKVERA